MSETHRRLLSLMLRELAHRIDSGDLDYFEACITDHEEPRRIDISNLRSVGTELSEARVRVFNVELRGRPEAFDDTRLEQLARLRKLEGSL